MAEYTNITDVIIEKALLTSYTGEVPSTSGTVPFKDVDISGLISEIEYFESIFDATVYGTAIILDTSDVFKDARMVGEEFLELSFITPALDAKVEKKFFIFKVESVNYNDSQDASVFQIHFTSEEHVVNSYKSVSKAYSGPYSDTVRDILVNSLGSTKTIKLEDTKGNQPVVIPNLSPIGAIMFCKSRACSIENPSSSYLFYENADGFNFVTAEYLVDPNNTDNEPFKPTKFTFLPQSQNELKGTSNEDGNQYSDFFQITNLNIQNGNDTLEQITDGAFRGTVTDHDMITKRIIINDYKFSENFESFTNLNDEPSHSRQWFEVAERDSAQKYYLPYDETKEDNFNRTFYNHRNSYMNFLESVKITAILPGNTKLRCGNIIEVELPLASSATDRQTDKKLSGRYLIGALVHNYQEGKLMTTVELYKDTFLEAV